MKQEEYLRAEDYLNEHLTDIKNGQPYSVDSLGVLLAVATGKLKFEREQREKAQELIRNKLKSTYTHFKIKYRALQCDNCQGGSGVPFKDEVIIRVPDIGNIAAIRKCVEKMVEELNTNTWVDQITVYEISLINPDSSLIGEYNI